MKIANLLLPLSFTILVFGVSCTSLDKAKHSVCFDGWTSDNSGHSEIWDVPNHILTKLQTKLPKSRQILCVHRMPSGQLNVVNIDHNKAEFATIFIFIEGGFIVKNENIIIKY